MIEGLLGKKIGMTHLFGDDGRVIPVTILEVGACTVTQVRTQIRDGYDAVQIGYGDARQLNKPAQGHLRGAGVSVRHLKEFAVADVSAFKVGQKLDVGEFQEGERVLVSAHSKGRGFQGVVKRHGFSGGPKTHGQGDRHRAPGSVGGTTYPGRVYKGKRMAGHMGDVQVTISNLRVEKVDSERNLLMLNGAVPGPRNGLVIVRHGTGHKVAAEA